MATSQRVEEHNMRRFDLSKVDDLSAAVVDSHVERKETYVCSRSGCKVICGGNVCAHGACAQRHARVCRWTATEFRRMCVHVKHMEQLCEHERQLRRELAVLRAKRSSAQGELQLQYAMMEFGTSPLGPPPDPVDARTNVGGGRGTGPPPLPVPARVWGDEDNGTPVPGSVMADPLLDLSVQDTLNFINDGATF